MTDQPARETAAGLPPVVRTAPVVAAFPFETALAFTLRQDIEGGWYDGSSSVDPNPTNVGVTLATWRRQRVTPNDLDHDGDVDAADLKRASRAELAEVYRADYWNAARCPEMPLPVAVVVIDTAVNCGGGAAALITQDALQIAEGLQAPRFGPMTMAGIREAMPRQLAMDILWERLDYYADLVQLRPAKRPALPHWTYRCVELWRYLQSSAVTGAAR
jgi:lysozyme family protein